MTSLPYLKSSFYIHDFALKEHTLTWAMNLHFLLNTFPHFFFFKYMHR